MGNHRILSYGYERTIVGEYTISAVYDALFGARDYDMRGAILFSTRFPTLDEMKLIVSAGLKAIYFMGEVNNPEVVRFSNSFSTNNIEIDMIKLERKI